MTPYGGELWILWQRSTMNAGHDKPAQATLSCTPEWEVHRENDLTITCFLSKFQAQTVITRFLSRHLFHFMRELDGHRFQCVIYKLLWLLKPSSESYNYIPEKGLVEKSRHMLTFIHMPNNWEGALSLAKFPLIFIVTWTWKVSVTCMFLTHLLSFTVRSFKWCCIHKGVVFNPFS